MGLVEISENLQLSLSEVSDNISITYKQSLIDTENSQIIKDEAYSSRDLTKIQLDNINNTELSIDSIKQSIESIEENTKELISKVSSI